MSRQSYPRLGSTRSIVKKQERRPAQHKKRCIVCGDVARSEVWIEVNWFRGDDEGPVPSCKEHKHAQVLLDTWAKPDTPPPTPQPQEQA